MLSMMTLSPTVIMEPLNQVNSEGCTKAMAQHSSTQTGNADVSNGRRAKTGCIVYGGLAKSAWRRPLIL